MLYRIGVYSYYSQDIPVIVQAVCNEYPEKIQDVNSKRLYEYIGQPEGIAIYADKKKVLFHFVFHDGNTEKMFSLEPWEAAQILMQAIHS